MLLFSCLSVCFSVFVCISLGAATPACVNVRTSTISGDSRSKIAVGFLVRVTFGWK